MSKFKINHQSKNSSARTGILSTEHGQNDAPSIESIFVADATPLATPTPTDDS